MLTFMSVLALEPGRDSPLSASYALNTSLSGWSIFLSMKSSKMWKSVPVT